jgi:hypothetical protein
LPDQDGEDSAVSSVQAGPWVGSTEYGDLVAQYEDLDVLGCRGPGKQR